MPRLLQRSIAFSLAAVAVACGSSSSPSTPSSPAAPGTGQLLAPTVFRVEAQKINATNNEIQFGWTSTEPSFQIVIGTTPGSSNLLTAQVTTNSFTWVSPRTGGTYYARVAGRRTETLGPYSDELTMFVLDIRNVIDAMFFHAGPMADVPGNAGNNPVAGVWADGTRLRVLVSNESTEASRANAQRFADEYASIVGGAITATTEMTSNSMLDSGGVTYPAALADFTVGIRVQPGFCGQGPLACAFYGPFPIGPNKSIITLAQAGGLNIGAVAHEMGHAYGIGHVTTPASGRAEFRFMMNPSVASEQMTEAEKLAITVAFKGGLRPGMTRDQAQAADLVNPYTGTSNISRVPAVSRERRDSHGWILVDAGQARPPPQSRPDFSGTWTRVSETQTTAEGAKEPVTMFSFGPTVTIAQDAKVFKIAVWTLALDGTPSKDLEGAVSKAAWSGPSLVLTETEPPVDGKPANVHKVMLTLAKDGTLVVDITAADAKLLHSVYRKSPARATLR